MIKVEPDLRHARIGVTNPSGLPESLSPSPDTLQRGLVRWCLGLPDLANNSAKRPERPTFRGLMRAPRIPSPVPPHCRSPGQANLTGPACVPLRHLRRTRPASAMTLSLFLATGTERR